MLIDNEHKLLCLDETHAMREKVRGEQIQLVAPPPAERELAYTERLVLSVRLSGIANRQVLLQLDSGSDGPILYPSTNEAEREILKQAARRIRSDWCYLFVSLVSQIGRSFYSWIPAAMVRFFTQVPMKPKGRY